MCIFQYRFIVLTSTFNYDRMRMYRMMHIKNENGIGA